MKRRSTSRFLGIWADDLPDNARIWAASDEPTPQDYLDVVLEEWMRPDVGITIVTRPEAKNTSDDFEVRAYNGRIVGAEARDV